MKRTSLGTLALMYCLSFIMFPFLSWHDYHRKLTAFLWRLTWRTPQPNLKLIVEFNLVTFTASLPSLLSTWVNLVKAIALLPAYFLWRWNWWPQLPSCLWRSVWQPLLLSFHWRLMFVPCLGWPGSHNRLRRESFPGPMPFPSLAGLAGFCSQSVP